MGFSILVDESHGVLFHQSEPVATTGKVTLRKIVAESYRNTSCTEYVHRIIQSLCTLLVFITTLVNYTSNQGDTKRGPIGWWSYTLILCGCTIPFLIYVAFFEGWVLVHVGLWRRLLIILSIIAEAAAAFWWLFGTIGLVVISCDNAEGLKIANIITASGAVATSVSFWIVAYSYWHALRNPPPVQTTIELYVDKIVTAPSPVYDPGRDRTAPYGRQEPEFVYPRHEKHDIEYNRF